MQSAAPVRAPIYLLCEVRSSCRPAGFVKARVVKAVRIPLAGQNLEASCLAMHYIADVVIWQHLFPNILGRRRRPAHEAADDLVVLSSQHGAGHVEQPPARRQQWPKGLEQGQLQLRALVDVGFSSQQLYIRVTAYDAGAAARRVEQYAVEAFAVPPRFRIGCISGNKCCSEPKALEIVADERESPAVHIHRRQTGSRAAEFQQMSGFATRGRAGVEDTQRALGRDRIPQ